MEEINNFSDLPREMIWNIASFLDKKSLKKFSEVSYEILEGVKPIVVERCWYRGNLEAMNTINSLNMYLPVRHIVIGLDWTHFVFPVTAWLHRYELRGLPAKNIHSLHIEHQDINRVDMANLLKFATELKSLSIGPFRHKADHLKTLMLTASTKFQDDMEVLKGFKRIIVRTLGPIAPGFMEALQTIISQNETNLSEIDIQGLINMDVIDLSGIRRMSSLRTAASISDLVDETQCLPFVKVLQCSIQSESPVFRTCPNTNYLLLNIQVNYWEINKLGKFFPNLEKLELKSSYLQQPVAEERKITMNQLTMIRGRMFGVMACTNVIAPNLRKLEMIPLSRVASDHCAKYSKGLKVIRGRDYLTEPGKILILQSLMTSHTNLELLQVKHNVFACACEIWKFASAITAFVGETELNPKMMAEFFFEANEKYGEDIIQILKMIEGCTITKNGNNLRINVDKREANLSERGKIRILVKLVSSVSTPRFNL